MTLYLKGHQKYDRSKLKVQLLLSKFRLFNFDLSYLLYPLRYKVTQYLIRKLSDMVKMGIEGLAVAALLISVKASQKLKIYYINRALSKLNCYALYKAKSFFYQFNTIQETNIKMVYKFCLFIIISQVA